MLHVPRQPQPPIAILFLIMAVAVLNNKKR